MTTPEQFLIYDGDCAVCSSCARWIEARWTRSPSPVAVPFQYVGRDWPALATPRVADMRESVWWIDADHCDAGARAVARALVATSSPWRLAGLVLLAPPVSWLAAPVYRFIARHRHLLPGATPTCAVPPGGT